jgi:hypothetical protein
MVRRLTVGYLTVPAIQMSADLAGACFGAAGLIAPPDQVPRAQPRHRDRRRSGAAGGRVWDVEFPTETEQEALFRERVMDALVEAGYRRENLGSAWMSFKAPLPAAKAEEIVANGAEKIVFFAAAISADSIHSQYDIPELVARVKLPEGVTMVNMGAWNDHELTWTPSLRKFALWTGGFPCRRRARSRRRQRNILERDRHGLVVGGSGRYDWLPVGRDLVRAHCGAAQDRLPTAEHAVAMFRMDFGFMRRLAPRRYAEIDELRTLDRGNRGGSRR